MPIWIQDPWDFDLPKVGLLQLQDPENPNQTLSIQSYNTDVVKAFLDRKKAHREKVKALFKKHRLDFMEVRAGEDFIYPLTKFFKMRGR